MTEAPSRPVFPLAPEEYQRVYFDDLVRTLSVFVEQQLNAGAMRGTTLVLTELPTNGNKLETGSVYNDQGTLKIVLSNVGYAPSLLMSASIGTVTVTPS